MQKYLCKCLIHNMWKLLLNGSSCLFEKCLHQDKNRVEAIVICHPRATMWFKMTLDWWQLITVTMTILIHLFCLAKTKTTRASMRCQDCRCRWNVAYIFISSPQLENWNYFLCPIIYKTVKYNDQSNNSYWCSTRFWYLMLL